MLLNNTLPQQKQGWWHHELKHRALVNSCPWQLSAAAEKLAAFILSEPLLCAEQGTGAPGLTEVWLWGCWEFAPFKMTAQFSYQPGVKQDSCFPCSRHCDLNSRTQLFWRPLAVSSSDWSFAHRCCLFFDQVFLVFIKFYLVITPFQC